MHTVVGPHRQLVEVARDFHPGEAPGEGLFVDVGMVKDSCFEDTSVAINDLPPVGIMVPTGVLVQNAHLKLVYTIACLDYLHLDNVRLSGEAGYVPSQQNK